MLVNQKTIKIGNITIEYDVRISPKSKRLTINVTPGNVEVVVPVNTPDEVLDDFIYRKRRWIFDKVDDVESAYKKQMTDQPTKFQSGAKIPYRGRNIGLVVTKKDVTKITIEYKGKFLVTIPKELEYPDYNIQKKLEFWLQQRLTGDCKQFAQRYSNKLNLHPKGIRVKEQKHIWGSCSKDKIININWHLVFAPKQILEYVVAHEVCHLKYRNHSPAFWKLLGQVFPDWEYCKSWLEKNKQVWETRI
jgi:predicted metal-dependent hydrolase